VSAVIIILLLLIACGVWFYFSDKACCCLKDKIRACKTRSKSWLKEKLGRKNDRVQTPSTLLVQGEEESSRVALKDTPNWQHEPSHDIESQIVKKEAKAAEMAESHHSSTDSRNPIKTDQ